MARPLRISYPGAWYHVMNRGAGRRAIFRTDKQRGMFLELLGDLYETYGVEIHAYCLLDTHYHLLLHTPRGNISRAMRHLDGIYTQRYNRLRGLDGPLFRGRYKAILVDADGYLLQASRYIHLNPVEGGLVESAGGYRWSSYRAYLGEVKAQRWLNLETILGMVGGPGARVKYRAFVEEGVDEGTRAFYGKKRREPILGSEEFWSVVTRRLGRLRDSREVPEARRLRRLTVGAITARVAEVFGIGVDRLLQSAPGRGKRNIPRLVAMGLARKLGGHELQTIAEAFHVGHYSSVSVAVSRLESLMREDKRLRRKVDEVKNGLTN